MTEDAYRRARAEFLRCGEVDPDLLRLLRRAVSRLIRFGGLPPIYSPTGRWDQEAEREVLADWLAGSLLGSGQLAALLHQAAVPRSFLRLGELYLRRQLINRLSRRQATNLYPRVRSLLEGDPAFEAAEYPGYWRLVGGPTTPWRGSEVELVAAAWRLGDFQTIRYREDAKKLSPLLERSELARFLSGLLGEAKAALTLDQIMRTLVARFDLGDPAEVELGEAENTRDDFDVVEQIAADAAARAAVAELSARQVEVLRRQLDDLTVREIAVELRVSVGTVSAEQRVIAETLGRLSSEQQNDRGELLNALRDLLFIGEEES